MTRALVLVDGEHYPPVILRACRALEHRGYTLAGAAFLGGGEKTGGPPDLGSIPVATGATPAAALEEALRRFAPEVVLDVSDAPVVDAGTRDLLAAVSLAHGVDYEAAGVRYTAPERPRLAAAPAIAVIGSGKRTGKTALCGYAARRYRDRGERPVIVCMGRGGPEAPLVVRGEETLLGPDDLLALATRGEHAAGDLYEDAITSRVTTVGAWRAGAGPAGDPMAGNVAAAVAAANALNPDLLLLEGSGTAIPPVAADTTVLALGGATPAAEIRSAPGRYRLLLADLVVVTMAEEPALSIETIPTLSDTLHGLARDIPVVRTVFRPRPLAPVGGRTVLLATTAPDTAQPILRRHLEEVHGARVVGVTHRLGDRAALAEDLARGAGTYEVLLTEIKAAAIDVAARAARVAGAEIVFVDNEAVSVSGDLDGALDALREAAVRRARVAAH